MYMKSTEKLVYFNCRNVLFLVSITPTRYRHESMFISLNWFEIFVYHKKWEKYSDITQNLNFIDETSKMSQFEILFHVLTDKSKIKCL